MNDNILKGRLSDADAAAAAFNCSLQFDKRLYKHDIRGSIAHAEMLAKCGIITDEECKHICGGLEEIKNEIESGALVIENAEDIHMFIEAALTKKIGAAGKKLHTARSRNDQVAVDLRLYVMDSIRSLQNQLAALVETLAGIAENNTGTVMCAYTHLQKAQPVTLAHYLLAYCNMLLRDAGRFSDCYKRADVCPLGSGAASGTTFPIDREFTAKLLGFSAVGANSIDGVSDRDFAIEYTAACALTMMHLSRLCEELILFSTDEYGLIEIGDAFTTTSSMMPQKKNPDMCELIRGKTGRVYGDLTALLTMMKGLPLAYNKDMQEDKEALFDAGDTLAACLSIFTAMVKDTKFNSDKMKKSAEGGFITATDAADYLVKKGAAFRDAHEIVGRLVKYCLENKKKLPKLTISEYKKFSPLFETDIADALSLKSAVNNRKSTGGPSPIEVKKEIRKIKSFLGTRR